MKYLIYTIETGRPEYIQSAVSVLDLNYDTGTQAAIELSIQDPFGSYVDGGILVSIPAAPSSRHVWDWTTKTWDLPESAMEDANTEARAAIDAAAGSARARYLTIAPGQDATYAAKYADAIAYVAAAYPVDTAPYPWIAAEANSTGLSPQAAADRIKAIGDYWGRVKGPQIESTRIAGKDSLFGMETVEQIDAHRAAVVDQLNSM